MAENKPSKKKKATTPEDAAVALGAAHPAPVALAPSTLANPYRPEDEQLMEMKPVIVGPPGYGSPDPETNKGALLPLNQHPLRETHIADDYGEGYGANLTARETLAPSPGPGTGSDGSEDDEDEVDATDEARELADENDVDLSEVDGSGQDGRVLKSDVEDFIRERDADQS